MLQLSRMLHGQATLSSFKPHQRGGGCCSIVRDIWTALNNPKFQTPSAGRWVLQPEALGDVENRIQGVSNPISGEVGAAATYGMTKSLKAYEVSNPISGEVGAAAWALARRRWVRSERFKPHQRGGGCCSCDPWDAINDRLEFQTPSAGRWVLQLKAIVSLPTYSQEFQTPSAGRWVLQQPELVERTFLLCKFQTPSAGRWVLQRDYPGWRGRGSVGVSNPISGEVGAAARGAQSAKILRLGQFQTPSAGRWVLQPWNS